MKRILLVDLEDRIKDLRETEIKIDEFNTTIVKNDTDALAALEKFSYVLIMMGEKTCSAQGEKLCRKMRARVDCPIVFVSFLNQTEDILRGLEAGADDYLCMPIRNDELKARIVARIRQEERIQKLRAEHGELCCSGVEIKLDARRVLRDGKEIKLSGREFELLVILMQNAGRPMSRQELFQEVWKTEYGDISAVAFNIKNLRAKLDPDGRLIRTIWGQGYQFIRDIDE